MGDLSSAVALLPLVAAGAGVGFLVGLTGRRRRLADDTSTDLEFWDQPASRGRYRPALCFDHQDGWELAPPSFRSRRLADRVPARDGKSSGRCAAACGHRFFNIDTAVLGRWIRMGLVVALPLSAIAIVVYPFVTRTAPQEDLGDVPPRTIETVLFGVALGLLVTLTSVGAGAIGVTVLAALYPALPGKRLVGSDITPHASRGRLGHLGLGNVDGSLLLALLCGSIPGILIGARLAGVVPERVLRPILAVTLCYAAYALYKK